MNEQDEQEEYEFDDVEEFKVSDWDQYVEEARKEAQNILEILGSDVDPKLVKVEFEFLGEGSSVAVSKEHKVLDDDE